MTGLKVYLNGVHIVFKCHLANICLPVLLKVIYLILSIFSRTLDVKMSIKNV